jgi:hypothetical protein
MSDVLPAEAPMLSHYFQKQSPALDAAVPAFDQAKAPHEILLFIAAGEC